MELSDISGHLKKSIQGKNPDALDLSPGEIAGFLDICRKSLNEYIIYANQQLGQESDAYIPKIELEKIDSIFRELTDNFFPMAHSNESLRRLQIIDKDEYSRIAEGLVRLSSVGEEALDLSDNLSQSIRRLINP